MSKYLTEEQLRQVISTFPMEEPGYLTKKQVALIYDCSESRIQRLTTGANKNDPVLESEERTGKNGKYLLYSTEVLVKYYLDNIGKFANKVINDREYKTVFIESNNSENIIPGVPQENIVKGFNDNIGISENELKEAIYFLQYGQTTVNDINYRIKKLEESVKNIGKAYENRVLPDSLKIAIERANEDIKKFNNLDSTEMKFINNEADNNLKGEDEISSSEKSYLDQYIAHLKDELNQKDEKLNQKDDEITRLHNESKTILIKYDSVRGEQKLLLQNVKYFIQGKIEGKEIVQEINKIAKNTANDVLYEDDEEFHSENEFITEEDIYKPEPQKKKGFFSRLFGKKGKQ